jgi:hypothetical protein
VEANVKTKIFFFMLLFLMTIILPVSVLAQEMGFMQNWYDSNSEPFGSSNSIEKLQVNRQNRCYFVHTFFWGPNGQDLYLHYFDIDNQIYSRFVFDGIFENFIPKLSLFGVGVGIPKISGSNFNWYYYNDNVTEPVISQTLTLPTQNTSLQGISQLNEEKSAVLFTSYNPERSYWVACMDSSANVLWDCNLPTTAGGLNDGTNALAVLEFSLLDNSTIAVVAGIYSSASPTTVHIMTFDHNGLRLSDTPVIISSIYEFSLHNNLFSGNLMFQYYIAGQIRVAKINPIGVENVVSFDSPGPTHGLGVTADADYITILLDVQGANHLNLIKFNWEGLPLYANTAFHNATSSVSDWLAETPTGNHICCTHTTPQVGNAYSTIGKVISSDFSTNNNDQVSTCIVTKVSSYPNPFRTNVTFKIEMKQDLDNQIRIYNIRGQLVMEFPQTHYQKGENKVIWDGRDSNGKNMASGVYLVNLHGESIDKYCKFVKLAE